MTNREELAALTAAVHRTVAAKTIPVSVGQTDLPRLEKKTRSVSRLSPPPRRHRKMF
jgi:hypothetical protein